MKKLLSILSLLAAFSLTACDTDGPYEEAGEDLDDATMQDTDWENRGERIDESVEETEEQVDEGYDG